MEGIASVVKSKFFITGLVILLNIFAQIMYKHISLANNKIVKTLRKGEVKLKRVADEKCDTWLRFRTTP